MDFIWQLCFLWIQYIFRQSTLKGTNLLQSDFTVWAIYTTNSKKVVFWIVALCIAHCCIPRALSTMDVTNLYIRTCQDRTKEAKYVKKDSFIT